MTARLLKTQIANSFGEGADLPMAVERHRQALIAHQFTEGVPPPSDALLDQLIKRIPKENAPSDFIADYEIVDDSPLPPTLEQKKDALEHAVSGMAMRARAEIIPPRKLKTYEFKYGDIYAKVPKDRTPEDKQFLEEYSKKTAASYAIDRHIADLHSEIEDLTAETIDTWKPAPFPS